MSYVSLITGPFSRTAVNFNAGCKSSVSNIVMATAVMITLVFLTPLFHYTPLVVLSSIIIAAMLGLIDYEAAIHLWKIDKFDFVVCISSYIGVIFGSVEIGLITAVRKSKKKMRPNLFMRYITIFGYNCVCGPSISCLFNSQKKTWTIQIICFGILRLTVLLEWICRWCCRWLGCLSP